MTSKRSALTEVVGFLCWLLGLPEPSRLRDGVHRVQDRIGVVW